MLNNPTGGNPAGVENRSDFHLNSTEAILSGAKMYKSYFIEISVEGDYVIKEMPSSKPPIPLIDVPEPPERMKGHRVLFNGSEWVQVKSRLNI